MTPQFMSRSKKVNAITVPYKMLEGFESYLDQEPSSYILQLGEEQDQQPLVMVLPPWLNSADSLVNWRAFKESVPARFSRLHKQGDMPDCLVVFPRLFTYFGGSQFVDSDMLGKHASWVCLELIEYLEKKYKISKKPVDRIVMGRSSGGFAAIRFAMDFPGVFGKILCHSGDMGFDTMLQRDMVFLSGHLQKYDRSIVKFLKYAESTQKLSGSDLHALMLVGYSAFYSGNKKGELCFPADLKTAELNNHWQKWLAHDPLVRADQSIDALKKLDLLYLDCGNRDQYYLQYGMRRLSKKLKEHSVEHSMFEFDDNHSGTEYRFDTSLKLAFA